MKTPTQTLGKYKITYQNGVVQICDLISQADYRNIIKPTKDIIYDLKLNGLKDEANEYSAMLKEKFGDNYFTTGSPIFEASKTGFLVLPKHQGGTTICTVIKHPNP